MSLNPWVLGNFGSLYTDVNFCWSFHFLEYNNDFNWPSLSVQSLGYGKCVSCVSDWLVLQFNIGIFFPNLFSAHVLSSFK